MCEKKKVVTSVIPMNDCAQCFDRRYSHVPESELSVVRPAGRSGRRGAVDELAVGTTSSELGAAASEGAGAGVEEASAADFVSQGFGRGGSEDMSLRGAGRSVSKVGWVRVWM